MGDHIIQPPGLQRAVTSPSVTVTPDASDQSSEAAQNTFVRDIQYWQANHRTDGSLLVFLELEEGGGEPKCLY